MIPLVSKPQLWIVGVRLSEKYRAETPGQPRRGQSPTWGVGSRFVADQRAVQRLDGDAPEALADGDEIGIGGSVLEAEGAAGDGRDIEQGEGFAGDGLDGRSFGSVRSGHGARAGADGGGGGEDRILIVPVHEVERGDAIVDAGGREFPENHDLAGLVVGQRAQERGLHHAEDGRIRSDAECEHDHGGQGETGGAGKDTEGVAEVLHGRLDGGDEPGLGWWN